eukprot:GHVN01067251.1.p1 GENE.GHVN01067251.1~~GHVN01067251.1.p1  ORF type:complete len:161 (-),score=19.09 GHVN01067251.1:874-1356(-)
MGEVDLPGPIQIAAYDCRGHGDTTCANNVDLSSEKLVDDGILLINHLLDDIEQQRSLPAGADDVVPERSKKQTGVILAGHSMGGAIASKIAGSGVLRSLVALIALDVVEGVALEALPSMLRFVRRFPKTFPSKAAATQWTLSNGLSLDPVFYHCGRSQEC